MNAHTITLIAPDRLEERQAGWWRSVADKWPDPHNPPSLQLASLDLAIDDPGAIRGHVAVVFLDGASVSSASMLADTLYEQRTPAIFLFEHVDERALRLNSEDVIVLDHAVPPSSLAGALFAMMRRQPAIERALQEVRTSSRLQAGAHCEIGRVQEELSLAAQVQRDLLPRSLPVVPNIDISVMYRPCGYVSGDIYDVARLDEHHLAFFLADAIGHGVPAALMTMVLCRGLPMKEIVGDSYTLVPPDEALSRLNNEMIRRQGETARFASAVYGVMDTRNRSIEIASAGHPPSLHFTTSGVDRIETDGPLLGVFPDAEYGRCTVDLSENDLLLLYSDGFETAFPDPGADGYGRRLPTRHYLAHFEELARRVRDGARLHESVGDLARSLDNQAGSLHQVDDLTALALCGRTGKMGESVFENASRVVTLS